MQGVSRQIHASLGITEAKPGNIVPFVSVISLLLGEIGTGGPEAELRNKSLQEHWIMTSKVRFGTS